MNTTSKLHNNPIKGVMFNAYPDSIGSSLSDIIEILQLPDFESAFSLFYILPTFFNSDLDRGFSIIDYDINQELVKEEDLIALKALGINTKFDIVLNHLSVGSPQFKDILKHGDTSAYKDFFIDWNEFWSQNGDLGEDGVVVPHDHYLSKLFMRKSGLPILMVPFPDGSIRPYWNTFYQSITYQHIDLNDLSDLAINDEEKRSICLQVNKAIDTQKDITALSLGIFHQSVKSAIAKKTKLLGQMDVNAKSDKVWEYYEEVLAKLKSYGCSILRLDAFAYLHKEVGQSNFFNKPGTWVYLERINAIANRNGLKLLPEIHAEYGLHLHDEVAEQGYVIYDFFLPGLIIHAIEKNTKASLALWANEIINKGLKTVNMLGCHDGIPVLDLKGKEVNGTYQPGLLVDEEIDELINLIIDRGGKVKNLYNAEGQKLSYYQVNATYYSALGENDKKMLLARAIQMFMPGTPQVWYLDLFAGKNDYEAVERAGKDGHKEINRTTLSMDHIGESLTKDIVKKQLELIKLRNIHPAFMGKPYIKSSPDHTLEIVWTNDTQEVSLMADLRSYEFKIQ